MTVFHRTNLGGPTENIRVVTRGAEGTLQTNAVLPISHLETQTIATHFVNVYTELFFSQAWFRERLQLRRARLFPAFNTDANGATIFP